ncbi:SusC/RagA family TonB-linked outer membrane protein [Pedobacter frigoris]|uniref:SusC/RagA family TonB-linked outer membrane protein n=1 Tax=Pedobacter frigoris TaxID=2571272 RepID=UPI00292DBE01|nr:SusC/RagA family TonB-linked outer membrane protein [Pedobacter frigoris]
MKLTIFLSIAILLQVSAAGYGQKISLSKNNISIEDAFKQIEKQSGYTFFYSNKLLRGAKIIDILSLNGATIEEALQKCLAGTSLGYVISEKTVVIRKAVEIPVADPVIISGKVVNEHGEELAGITVAVKGTKTKTMTNAKGEFTISAPDKMSILVFTSIGYSTKEISAAVEMRVVKLDASMSKLAEIVITGYGVTERRNLTGAIGSLKPNVIGSLPNNIDNAMVGRIAGVQITPSGVPGSASAITIRGITSINGKGNSPLIVIDGIPMYGIDRDNNTSDFSGRTYGAGFTGNVPNALKQNERETFERNPLDLINPEDVESIEVLKDAYATAIYGSRGASGVILIKTKQGRLNTPKIGVQLSTSFNRPFGERSMMSGDQYADFYTAYFKARNRTNVFPKGVNTDWINEIQRTGHGYNGAFNISNGNEKGNYYISGSYAKDQPYITSNDYERIQGRINLNQSLSKTLNVGTSLTLSSTSNNALDANLMYGDAAIAAPNKPILNAFGSYVWDNWNNPLISTIARDMNPVGYAATTTNTLGTNNVVGNLFAELKLTPWAKLRSELGVDWETARAFSRFSNKPRTLGGLASETNSWRRKWVINNTLTVSKTTGAHNLNAVLGQSFEKSTENSSNVYASNFPNDEVLSLNAAGSKVFGSALQQQWALVSYFGRFNYVFEGKYMAGVTYRLDGSSKFSADRRYVGFPSFSLGWDLKQENFLADANFIDQLKLRGSLGLSGSDGGTGYYGNKGTYNNVPGGVTWAGDNAIIPQDPNNPDLKWETRTKYNAGADLSFFQSALNLTVDYYHERTKNAILSFPIPAYLGFVMQQQNVGELTNKGVELTLNSTNINSKNFKWSSSFNITRNVNRVEKLYEKNDLTDPIVLGLNLEKSTGKFLMEGQPATAFFLYQWNGVNPANGNPMWTDQAGNITEKNVQLPVNGAEKNRRFSGDAAPKFFGGIDNTFNYKGFEFNAFFSYSYGNKMINGSKAYLYAYTSNDANNLSTDLLDYWKTPGQETDIPALLNASNSSTIGGVSSPLGTDYTLSRTSTRFLEDASFIKLRTTSLAYNFSTVQLKRIGFSSLKLYAQADNVFVITKYSGIDPEVSAFGSSALQVGRDEFTLPSPRTFRLGIKMGF